MKVLEIAFVGYCVTDMKRAQDFYEGVLGLTPARTFGDGEKFAWVEYDIGPGTLALVSGGGEAWSPSPKGTAAALEVDDLDAFLAKLKASGVRIVTDLQDTPVCRMFVAADPDGNRIGLHQRKRT